VPLAELPAKELRDYGRYALAQADWAARLDALDWHVLQSVQSTGADLPLPEAAPLKTLAAALQVRFRAEVAGRRFDDAVRTAKTMLALARHLGEYPSAAANLVGLSVAQMACDTLEEMVQQPGCPNLYWALTDLPCPLVELRKGVQGDRTVTTTELRALLDTPMTEAELEKVVSRLSGIMGITREQAGSPPRSLRAALDARVKDAERVRAARGRLVEAGCPEGQVAKLAPTQVVLLDEKRDYEFRRDDAMKLLALAPWQIDALADEEPRHTEDGLLADLLPQVVALRRAQGRLEQHVALLRHVEALRQYSAAHDGKLPGKLSDVRLPLPGDPFTGKSFGYSVEGATAHLRGSPPRGEESNPRYNVTYQVTIHK
jgi:hypothetical protein